ncbi:tRNA pseudouridine(55) synthase TruB [Aeromicrobium sp. PE09-221]|uniref:tRNA pseudouridine(55) synthase TruB n=1 Tax=Aeromicrobium sp. PE09-221 TaxID=1898043 RepID=UPI000B3EAD41|nr:tRNA pseudouridine(55) synthase TruB [Aeromicrobium sp. PE09-221]OUZ07981.1 tRNA pseudouridine(55) synthase TruB [Aeromicrobium sp. PE09-221]
MGLVIVDKPTGWTSHDVVGRMRRLAQTRKVGHAGTLDPMATGVLVLGIGRATRLLGHLQLADKEYLATIRLGESTVTDDAEGEVIASMDASGLTREEIDAAIRPLTGEVEQVPSKVSAVKVDGRRSYARVRAGEDVELAARPVTVSVFEVTEVRAGDRATDVDVRVVCSSGTYVRALARDLGASLGVGGHLMMLRRTRVGGFGLDQARTLDQLEERLDIIGLDDAARAAFEARRLDEDQARLARHGRALEGLVLAGEGPTALFGPDGNFLALYEQRGASARALAVFV